MLNSNFITRFHDIFQRDPMNITKIVASGRQSNGMSIIDVNKLIVKAAGIFYNVLGFLFQYNVLFILGLTLLLRL